MKIAAIFLALLLLDCAATAGPDDLIATEDDAEVRAPGAEVEEQIALQDGGVLEDHRHLVWSLLLLGAASLVVIGVAVWIWNKRRNPSPRRIQARYLYKYSR